MEEVETPNEMLIKQHRKEKKDLQATIQSMKNGVPKNDKKRRKQLTEEISNLETELNQKQEEELKQLNFVDNSTTSTDSKPCKVDEVVNGVESLGIEGEMENGVKATRVSKAQKRRDKKAAHDKERESRIAEAEVENLSGLRHQEGLKLSQKLAERQLQIKEISSDGHCMYRAIEDQLLQLAMPGLNQNLKELRKHTAEHMRSNADNFLPFLTNSSTGDIYTADEFEKYCCDVEQTAAWGGQLELQALTQILQLPIEVIQADSPTIKIGEEFDKAPITLIYMRHAYGLGEHYNSVERLKDTAQDEES
ncbi:deubiquitinase OTUD6B isoform 2-T2 [Aplochiton taeniatus]